MSPPDGASVPLLLSDAAVPGNSTPTSTQPSDPAVGRGAIPSRPPGAPPISPSVFLDRSPTLAMQAQVQQQQRASLSSMLFMTFFFFMMSNNGNDGAGVSQEMIEAMHRTREVDWMRTTLGEWECILNGTKPVDAYGNEMSGFEYPMEAESTFETLLPLPVDRKIESEDEAYYNRNITGFYRNAQAHFLNLTNPATSHSVRTFFRHLHPSAASIPSPVLEAGAPVGDKDPYSNESGEFYIAPLINVTTYNYTEAEAMRGDFAWSDVVGWEMNMKEKPVVRRDELGEEVEDWGDPVADEAYRWVSEWTWAQASITFSTPEQASHVNYDLNGFHHLPTGTYTLLGMPEDQTVDIRQLPILFPERDGARDRIVEMITWEMRRRWKVVRETMLMAIHGEDDPDPVTVCPLYLQFRLAPFSATYTRTEYDAYEAEQRDPTGIWLPGPPGPLNIDGVGTLQGCGIAFGMEKGEGLSSHSFWSKTINYSIYASVATFVSLLLLVQQMESTRTPSALAKVSFWTIAMMVGSDSWLFSAHVVVAIMSDNSSSLPLLVPGLFCLCTAIVFGPRFAVNINRIQASENSAPPRPIAGSGNSPGAGSVSIAALPSAIAPDFNVRTWLADEWFRYPQLRYAIPVIILFFLLIFDALPNIVPMFLGGMYSFWIPQIWRNATRGNRKALTWKFVLGSSVVRLALPIYAFACPTNVFFTSENSIVWYLAIWVWIQVLILALQDRFGPAFFLPKSFAPAESFDYHQPIPQSDPEALTHDFGDCSICMEPIEIESNEVDEKGDKTAASVLNINLRRTYALAPCHHLYHTTCLSQWLAVKQTCPLCKASLPPL